MKLSTDQLQKLEYNTLEATNTANAIYSRLQNPLVATVTKPESKTTALGKRRYNPINLD